MASEVERAPLPIVPVVPSDPREPGKEATVAIVGAEQQSRLEPIRRRPAPLLFGLLTGHEPFLGEVEPGRHRRVAYRIARSDGTATDANPANPSTAEEIRREAERSRALEAKILEELEKNERLLEQMKAAEDADTRPLDDPDLSERADPRAAPATPAERPLPAAIFDAEHIEIEPGDADWNNHSTLKLTRRVLDADRDGHPEQIRYHTRDGDVLVRVEKDTNYDGRIDTWDHYEEGRLTRRISDANHDGLPDTWVRYRGAHMIERIVDRDRDGVQDAFFTYQQGSLVEERHDSNNDGEIDLVTTYESRTRVATREDRNGDGRTDTWTTYQVSDGHEVPKRVERDTTADGKPDVFETYAGVDGEAVLTLREEDANGDGTIDIKSLYENGKLVRREISDPSLLPM